MPKRTTLRQRIVYLARRNLAGTDATVTESKLLADLDDGETREVDVVIEGTVGGEPVIIGIEVMEHSRPVDKPAVERLLRKHERLPTNRLVIVSWSGFYKPALAKVAASTGKALAVTTREVELKQAPRLFVDSFTASAKTIVLVVRAPDGELMRVSVQHGDGIDLHELDGEVIGKVEDLIGVAMHAPVTGRRLAELFHLHESKVDVRGFSLELPSLAQIPDLPPLFVKRAETGVLHEIVAVAVTGEFKGYQSQLDFKGLLLGDFVFGVGEAKLVGRDVLWVARQISDSEARLSWHFADAPPGA